MPAGAHTQDKVVCFQKKDTEKVAIFIKASNGICEE
jgi:hypothetical protein